MSVLSKYFDKNVNQSSPVQKDYNRVVNHDAEGNEFISFVEVDYPTIQASHGKVGDWSLDSLLKAGINPNFAIHTGNPTRLDGLDTVNAAIAEADAILAEIDANSEKKDE